MSIAPLQLQSSTQDTGSTWGKMHKSPSIEELSIIHRSSTIVEVCGRDDTFPSFLGTSEFFYDARAGASSSISCSGDEPDDKQQYNDTTPRYENPLITATSRELISDIHTLTRRYCVIDVPRPSSILCTLLRVRSPNKHDEGPWFKAIRMWAEVDDMSETESFDGHKKSYVEYTLNVLFFPDLHNTYRVPKTLMLHRPLTSSPSSGESQLSPPSASVPGSPSLPILGTPISVPSPLHFQLPVMTRLVFNEQGQITYHKDVWDARDVVQLIPGARMVLWIIARAGAWGLSWISQRIYSNMDSDADADADGQSDEGENGFLTSPADSYV